MQNYKYHPNEECVPWISKKKVGAVRYSLAASDTFGHGHRFEKKNTDTHTYTRTPICH